MLWRSCLKGTARRFKGVPTRWTFWLVVNDMDENASRVVLQTERPEGLLLEADNPHTRIWIKTWAQVIHEYRTRLKIIQQALNYCADKDVSLDDLKATYDSVSRGGDNFGCPRECKMITKPGPGLVLLFYALIAQPAYSGDKYALIIGVTG